MIMDIELGSIEAYRRWFMGLRERTPGLYSLIGPGLKASWSYGTTEAKCHWADHQAPAMDCTCGLYATTSPTVYICSIGGRVELFGKIIVHEHGYRAQYARVIDLYDIVTCFACQASYSLYDKGHGAVESYHGIPLWTYCPNCWSLESQSVPRKNRLEADELSALFDILKKLYITRG